VCEYIGVQRELVATSSIYGNASLKGSERVLDICAREGAQEYYNLPGGRELYSDEQFSARGVDLKFIQPRLAEYKQVAEEFLPGLSILDVLMFNSPEAAGAMVREGAAA
jgi:hypothetical protein